MKYLEMIIKAFWATVIVGVAIYCVLVALYADTDTDTDTVSNKEEQHYVQTKCN